MAEVTSTHAKVSAKADTADATLVQPSDWNEDHVFGAGTKGDLLYRDTGATNGASWLTSVAAGQVLRSGGAGSAPVWGDVDLTAEVSGVLPCANGGTGLSSYAVGDLLYASGATTVARLADVAAGQVLVSGGVGVAPAWSANPAVRTVTVGDSSVVSSATLGSTLVTNGTFDTDLTGWSYGGGSDWTHNTASAKHATGNTTSLSQSITVASGSTYQVAFTITGRTTGSVSVSIGTVSLVNAGADTAFASNSAFYKTIQANASGAVEFSVTPTSTFDGRIDTVSVKLVTVGSNTSLVSCKNSAGTLVNEMRAGNATSVGVGLGSLASELGGLGGAGSFNAAFGSGALASATNTSNSVAVGYRSLYATQNSVGNSAVGYGVLIANVSGNYNSSLGSQSLTSLTSGSGNTVSGAIAAYAATAGNYNSIYGYGSMGTLTTGSYNVSAGYFAGRYQADGATALTDPENSVYVGSNSRGYDNNDSNAIVIGYSAIGAGANKAVIGNSAITDVYFGSAAGLATIHSANPTPVTPVRVIRNGDDVYIRTAWTSTHDLVQRLQLKIASATTFSNNVVGLHEAGVIAVATGDGAVASSFSATLISGTDDACPIKINGTYIGGNHGASEVVAITVTGHGKTAVDVGSAWTDGVGRKFYIMRIVDANTLWILSENLSATDVWDFTTSISGSTLTHSAGATHTGALTIAGQVVTQLWPAVKNQVKSVLVDGTRLVADGEKVGGVFVDIVNTYDISDVPGILDYVISQVGSNPAPALDHASIPNCARMTVVYRIGPDGGMTVLTSVETMLQTELEYAGFVQAGQLVTPASGTVHEYIPKVASYVDSAVTYDFAAIQDITSLAAAQYITAARWTDANNPPERFVQLVKNSGAAKVFGLAIGLCQGIGVGAASTRKDNVATAGFVNTTLKVYPYGVAGASTTYPDSLVPAGTLFEAVAFRCPINYTTYPTATNVSWYDVGRDTYLMLDWHSDYAGYVPLPQRLVGKTISTVESDGVTVSSAFVTADGIRIAVTGYGTAVLKLT